MSDKRAMPTGRQEAFFQSLPAGRRGVPTMSDKILSPDFDAEDFVQTWTRVCDHLASKRLESRKRKRKPKT